MSGSGSMFHSVEDATGDDDCMMIGMTTVVNQVVPASAVKKAQSHQAKYGEELQAALVAAYKNLTQLMPDHSSQPQQICSDLMYSYIMARPEYRFPGIGKKEWQRFIMRHLTIAPCMNNTEEEDQIRFNKVNASLGLEPGNVSDEESADEEEYHESNLFSPETYKYNYCTTAVEVLLPVGSIPEYLRSSVEKSRSRLIRKLEEGEKKVYSTIMVDQEEDECMQRALSITMKDGTDDQGSSSQTGTNDKPKSDGADSEDEGEGVTEEREFAIIPENVWQEGRKVLSIAKCDDENRCLLCVLSRNDRACVFRRRSTLWFFRAYQAMFVLVKLVSELDSLVEKEGSTEVKQAVALAAFLKQKWEIPIGRVCPRYLRFRTENLLEQRDGRLFVTDVKTLFNVAVVTLDSQAHQTDLKREQAEFLAQPRSPDPASVRKRGRTAEFTDRQLRSQVATGHRFLTDRTTENDGQILVTKAAGEKGVGLFAVCDIMARDFVCEYWGLTDTPFDDENISCMLLSDKVSFVHPVGSSCIGQYINHQCKNASCGWKEVIGENGIEMWIQALRWIRAGEELTIDYNMKKGEREKVFACLCVYCIKHR